MDLSTLDTKAASEKAVFLHLRHPGTNAPLYMDPEDKQRPVGLMLLGRDSAAYVRHTRAVQNRALGEVKARGKTSSTAETLEADMIDGLVSVTAGWPEPFVLNGEKLEFSEANARKLYSRLPWMREQADQFLGDVGNFLKA